MTPPTTNHQVSIAQIMAAACQHYHITRDDLVARRRTRPIARRRQVAMYVARTIHGKPLSLIGHMFAGRDHATVIHANRTIAAELDAGNEAIAQDVSAVILIIQSSILAAQGVHS